MTTMNNGGPADPSVHEHLAEIARQWEPDHSSHTARRGHHTRPTDRLAADN